MISETVNGVKNITIIDEDGKTFKIKAVNIAEDKIEIMVDCKCLKCPIKEGCCNYDD